MEGLAPMPLDQRLLAKFQLDDLYARYAACLNEERFEDWPDFFVEDCVYKIVPRINSELSLPLATWWSEDKGYLRDRVAGIRRTMVFGPRYVRLLVGNIRICGQRDGAIEAKADYAAFETLPDELTRVFSVGESRDRVVAGPGGYKFKERLVVFDSELVPNSLIYPL